MIPPQMPRIDRRTAVKWVITAAAAMSLRDTFADAGSRVPSAGTGYGQDPDLMKEYLPGELWPLTFTATERRACLALCDVIIPADGHSPGAVAVGVADFIDEWISAPYPDQRRDRSIILEGLAWLDREAQRRHQLIFAALSESRQTGLCDDIRYEPDAAEEYRKPARFFARFRDLTASGFYTTPAGMKDLGYMGNVPLATFDGPPPAMLAKLGLA